MTDFRKLRIINFESTKLDSLYQPVDICVAPDANLLFVVDAHDRKYIKTYDLSSLKFIRSFVPKGPGLNQQLSCRSIQYLGDGKLYTTDTYKKKIFIYQLNDVKNRSAAILPSGEINIQNKYFYRPLVLPNNTEVQFHQMASKSDSSIFDFFDGEGKAIGATGIYPKLQKDFDSNVFNYAFMAGINYIPQKKRILLNYYHTSFLETYDIKGNLIKRIEGFEQFCPTIKMTNMYGGYMPYLSKDSHKTFAARVKGFKDRIFVLYDGRTIEYSDFNVNKLLMFDDDLRPMVNYQLNVPIFGFDIDSNNGNFYALTMKVAGVNLLKFKLP